MKILNHNMIPVSCRGLLIDLDNTLYPYDPCHAYALEQCFALYCREVHSITKQQFDEAYRCAQKRVKQHTKGQAASHARLLYFQSLLEEQLGRTMSKLTLDFERLYWEKFLDKMVLFPWVQDFFAQVRARGLRVALVTNLTAHIQLQKIVRLGLGEEIDFVVSSEAAGVEKPHPKFFRYALQKLALQPHEVICIGDNEKEDGTGALSLGIPFMLVH